MAERQLEPPIPLRNPAKVPLKGDPFAVAQCSNTQLLPLFPYAGPGDIVPCISALASDGSNKIKIGYFVHFNTVDEVALVVGGEGRVGRTGDVFVGQRSHGVGGWGDGSSEPSFSVIAITQRQLEEGEQKEAVIFQCEKCNTQVLRHEFGGSDYEAAHPGILPSILGAFEAATAYNQSDRRCPACGHTNPEFPLHLWGWGQHAWAHGIVGRGRGALEEAIKR